QFCTPKHKWVTSTKTSLRAGWMYCGYGFAGNWLQTTSAASWLWLHSRDEKRAGARVPLRHTRSLPLFGRGPRLGLREGERPTNGPAGQWRRPTDFRRRAGPPLQREANQPGFTIEALAKGSGCLAGPPAGLSSP